MHSGASAVSGYYTKLIIKKMGVFNSVICPLRHTSHHVNKPLITYQQSVCKLPPTDYRVCCFFGLNLLCRPFKCFVFCNFCTKCCRGHTHFCFAPFPRISPRITRGKRAWMSMYYWCCCFPIVLSSFTDVFAHTWRDYYCCCADNYYA